jgi:hypothetical protein
VSKKLKYCFDKLIDKADLIMLLFVVLILSAGCQKWDETKDASHVSDLPVFEITGGNFVSYIVIDSGKYVDPGAKAWEGSDSLNVYYLGDVDLTKVGVYTITYYAINSDGLWATDERVIAVTNNDVSDQDLSGKYTGTLWSPMVEMKVEKIDTNGLYECSEVLGFPNSKMKGRFVDLGNHELVLLHGKGDFGNYANSEGEYTLSTLSWTVSLVDDPYKGTDIDVLWRKIFEN